MSSENTLIGAGLLTAVASSLCCITPVLAIIAGTTGLASSFSWLEPSRPYLIGFTVLVLAFAWYQKLKPVAEDDCDCEVPKRPFLQSKLFLGLVTVFATGMLTFPLYAKNLLPSSTNNSTVFVDSKNLHTIKIEVSGMTCGGCEAHVEHSVSQLPGIAEVEASYEDEQAIVSFDRSQTNIEEIEEAIEKTEYQIGQVEIMQ